MLDSYDTRGGVLLIANECLFTLIIALHRSGGSAKRDDVV